MVGAFDVYLDGSNTNYDRQIPGPLTSLTHLGNIPPKKPEPFTPSYDNPIRGGDAAGGTSPTSPASGYGEAGYTAAVELYIERANSPITLKPGCTIHFETPAKNVRVQYPLGHLGRACLIGGSGCTMFSMNDIRLHARQIWSGAEGAREYRGDAQGNGIPQRILAWFDSLDIPVAGIGGILPNGWYINPPELQAFATAPDGAFPGNSYWFAPDFPSMSDSPHFDAGHIDYAGPGSGELTVTIYGYVHSDSYTARELAKVVFYDQELSLDFSLQGCNFVALDITNNTLAAQTLTSLTLKALSKEGTI